MLVPSSNSITLGLMIFISSLCTVTCQKPDVVVAADGSGNYRTVSEAVAVAPNNRVTRYFIHIKSGVYRENIEVPVEKTNIVFMGDGIGKTIITSDHSKSIRFKTFDTATVVVIGNQFMARDITFANSAGPEGEQAVALRCDSDRSVFHRCSFEGYQDTLYARQGKQFYRECDIYGTVDFIFGDATAVFQNCNIYARKSIHGKPNVFTAQGREEPGKPSGFVIHNCNFEAAEEVKAGKSTIKSYLGRPWKKYSKTIIMQSFLGDLVDPAGWYEYDGNFALDTLFYAEYENRGPGSNIANRVKWPGYKVITNSNEAMTFTVAQFLDGKDWIPSTGVPFTPNLL